MMKTKEAIFGKPFSTALKNIVADKEYLVIPVTESDIQSKMDYLVKGRCPEPIIVHSVDCESGAKSELKIINGYDTYLALMEIHGSDHEVTIIPSRGNEIDAILSVFDEETASRMNHVHLGSIVNRLVNLGVPASSVSEHISKNPSTVSLSRRLSDLSSSITDHVVNGNIAANNIFVLLRKGYSETRIKKEITKIINEKEQRNGNKRTSEESQILKNNPMRSRTEDSVLRMLTSQVKKKGFVANEKGKATIQINAELAKKIAKLAGIPLEIKPSSHSSMA